MKVTLPKDSWEGFLSYLLHPVSYLMSVTLQMLVPFSNYKVELDKIEITDPKIHRQLMEINNRILEEILIPIVKLEYDSVFPISHNYIRRFIDYSRQESSLLSPKIDIKQVEKLNLSFYQDIIDRLKKQQRLDSKSVKSAIELINILTDYMKTITALIQQRKSLLEKALHDIDGEDLINSIYGTMLSFLCISLILRKDLKDEDRFSAIVEAGGEYAKELEGYIDTLDILTNPDEDEYLRNINE